MKFGEFPLSEVNGAILAHSVDLGGAGKLKKGTVLGDSELAELSAAQIKRVMVAIIDEADVPEDDAATSIGALLDNGTLRIDKATTGRVNFFAKQNGVLFVDRNAIDAVNAIDPGITLATLKNRAEVNEGRMVATVKIIPYAVPQSALDQVAKIRLSDAIRVQTFRKMNVALVQSRLSGTKEKVLDKTRRVFEQRLELSGSVIVDECRVDHTRTAVRDGIVSTLPKADLVIFFGASAISDLRDVLPAAIEESGGEVIRFGMPVDPGNLLLLGEIGGKPIIGAPGCARSPAENGFDWVLQQILADVPLREIDIAGLGVGGLLMETGARPHPRLGRKKQAGKTAAIVLAAGQSRRMGDANKMTVEIHGSPMVRHVVENALAANVDHVLVVTGHEPERVHDALSGLNVDYVHNPYFSGGLSTSLATGISALPASVDHALILLGDMPFVMANMISNIVKQGVIHDAIAMATFDGKRGNPVLWPKRFFHELTRIKGDTGARHLIGVNAESVVEVEIGKAAALDLDTPEAIAAALAEN